MKSDQSPNSASSTLATTAPAAGTAGIGSDTSDLTLLGRPVEFPARPELATLETFANRTPQSDYWVTIETGEFSSLCPVTVSGDEVAEALPSCLSGRGLF
jgi:hypothetical protein